MTNAEVMAKLDELKAIFEHGKFWNHNPNQSNDPASVTNSPCSHHSTVNCELHVTTGACGCNSFGGGIQCYGFAFYMAYRVFGHYPDLSVWTSTNGGSCKNGWRGYGAGYLSGLTLEPGDVIRKDDHSAIVHTVVGDAVQVAEVWGNPEDSNYNCMIAWGYFNSNSANTASVILSTADYIMKAPKTTGSAITVTLNANGGTCAMEEKEVYCGSPYGDLPVPTRTGRTFMGWWDTSTNTECISSTTVAKNSNHTLMAIWGKTYKLTNVASGKCLNINGDNLTSLTPWTNVTLWSDSGSNEQKWILSTDYDSKPIKSVIDRNYGLNIYLDSTYNCNVYQVAGNETDSAVYFTNYGSYYRVGLHNYNRYLTAAGTGDGANVYWATYTESNLQKWVLTEI